MKAQQQRPRIAGMKAFAHNSAPQPTRGPVLGNFFQQVAMSVEKERKLRREVVDAKPRVQRGLNVSDAVSEGKRDFLNSSRASFADVVSRNGNSVPLWNVFSAPSKY